MAGGIACSANCFDGPFVRSRKANITQLPSNPEKPRRFTTSHRKKRNGIGSDVDYSFNLEAGGEKRLKGNATAVKLRKVLGDDYENLSPEQLVDTVEDLLDYEKKDALARA